MLVEITTSETGSHGLKHLYKSDGISIFVKDDDKFGQCCSGRDYFNFFTQEPIFSTEDINANDSHRYFDEKNLKSIQNEVTGISIRKERKNFTVTCFSAKISRSRLFFLIKAGSLYLSYDLRKLLPYSEKKLNEEIAFSIIKFGETPEYQTIVTDIFCVPGGRYIKCDNGHLKKYLNRGEIPEGDFLPYFQIRYTMTGGDLALTELALKETLQSISLKKPILLLSGGVDSSLLNFLYDEISDRPYPAVFFNFEEAPEEYEYAKRSVRNTKAELVPVTIANDRVRDDFLESIEALMYPVYDNGSVFVGYQFHRQFLKKREHAQAFIDGTLADSCYGVRNYNENLTVGKFQPEFISYFKEWIYSYFLVRNIGLTKTRPRDSFLSDEFMQDLLWYGGPFTNIWFYNAKKYTRSLKDKYYRYLDFLHAENRSEYWPVYTVLKLMLYAGKQTTVKTYDMFLPHQVYYPFMFTNVIEDQGKYTWQQKSDNGLIKAPLKKILGKYIDQSFIQRKKVGLQSQTKYWLLMNDLRPVVLALLSRKEGLADLMMGSKARMLSRTFNQVQPRKEIVSLALSVSVLQRWCDINGIKIQS